MIDSKARARAGATRVTADRRKHGALASIAVQSGLPGVSSRTGGPVGLYGGGLRHPVVRMATLPGTATRPGRPRGLGAPPEASHRRAPDASTPANAGGRRTVTPRLVSRPPSCEKRVRAKSGVRAQPGCDGADNGYDFNVVPGQ